MAAKKQLKFKYIIFGRVQGVGFRRFVAKKAFQHGVSGSVRNCSGGQVEVIATYDSQAQQQSFELELGKGPFFGKVKKLQKSEIEQNVPTGFAILFT